MLSGRMYNIAHDIARGCGRIAVVYCRDRSSGVPQGSEKQIPYGSSWILKLAGIDPLHELI